MGTLYHYECEHCSYTPDENLGLGTGMLGITTVLLHCTTCRELHLFDQHPGVSKPPRCPRVSWHHVRVLDEPEEHEPFRVSCPKCKRVNLMLETGLWD